MKPTRHLPEPAPLGDAGGRVELRLRPPAAETPEVVVYDARWFAGDQRFEGWIELHSVPLRVVIQTASAAPPEWLAQFTEALLRTTARSVKDGAWPRRLTRWRKP